MIACRPIAQIVEEGAIPELYGRVDPGSLLTQVCQLSVVEGHPID
jgi:hypothetical protein